MKIYALALVNAQLALGHIYMSHPHFPSCEPEQAEEEERTVSLKKMRMVNSFLQISTCGLLPIATQDLQVF